MISDRRYDGRSTMRDRFHWARLLAFVTGLVNQDLLLRSEYLIAENRILGEAICRCGCGLAIRSESGRPRVPNGLDAKR